MQNVNDSRDLCKLQAILKREQERLLIDRASGIQHDDASTLTDETLVEIDRHARLDHVRNLWGSLLSHCKEMEMHDPAVAEIVGTSDTIINCANITASIKEGLENAGSSRHLLATHISPTKVLDFHTVPHM